MDASFLGLRCQRWAKIHVIINLSPPLPVAILPSCFCNASPLSWLYCLSALTIATPLHPSLSKPSPSLSCHVVARVSHVALVSHLCFYLFFFFVLGSCRSTATQVTSRNKTHSILSRLKTKTLFLAHPLPFLHYTYRGCPTALIVHTCLVGS